MRSCMSMMLFQGSPPHHRGRLAQGLQGQWAPQSNGIGFGRSLRWWPEPRTRKTITMGEDGRQKKTRAQAALPETYVFNVFAETLCPSITLTVLQHSNPKTWTLRQTLSNWKERLQPTAQHPKPWIAKQHCGTGPQDSITKCTKTLKLDL
jgi:hypothetical protein